jgi:predicted DNA-binding protein (MmcQ/YjbR family)
MSKLHWNTVVVDHGITGRLLKDFIDDSYQLVLNSLPKAKQLSL